MNRHIRNRLRGTTAAIVLLCGSHEAAAQVRDLKRMTLEELAQQEVYSVSRAPEPYAMAPAAIQIITQDDIRRSGAVTIADALRLADSLIVAQKNAHDWAISARGFNTELANKLLVMIDGRTVYTPLFSGVFWGRQDYLLEDVERIEVISGPGGTLWGANAVNGVINIITRDALASLGLHVDAGIGSQVKGVTGARYGGRLGGVAAYRVYAKHTDRDGERVPSGADASDEWHMTRGGFRVDSQNPARDSWTIQGDIYSGDEQVPGGRFAVSSGGNVLARWSRAFSEESGLRLQAYYDTTHLALPTQAQVQGGVLLAPAGTLRDDLDTFDVDFQYRFTIGARQTVTSGGGYRFTHDVVQNAPGLGFVPATLNQALVSGFVQDEITLSPTLALIAGTKIEHNDYTGVEAEPSARLRWTPASTQMLWSAVSRAVRMPARVDRDERLSTPGLSPIVENLLIGGADFQSERLLAYELGYRGQIGPAVSSSVTVFHHRYDDLRSTRLGTPDPIFGLPFPFVFANDLEGDTTGLETSVTHQPLEWWRVRGAYTFLTTDIRVKPGRTDVNNALNENADPRHRLALRSSVTLRNVIELDAAFRWVGAFTYNNNGTPGVLPGYGELGMRLGWLPSPHLELSLVGDNLLHEQHAEYVTSGPNPRVEISRHVYVRTAVRW